MTPDIESALARHAIRRVVVIGPILIVACWIWRGPAGAAASAVGLAIVAGYVWFSGAMLSVAARISLGAYHAAALLGFFLRLGLIAMSMLVVARVTDIDRIALGITVVVAYLTLLGWEAVAVAKGRERELEWTT